MTHNTFSLLHHNATYKFRQHEGLTTHSEELKYFWKKYRGLCELISNYVLMQDMLGTKYVFSQEELTKINEWKNERENAYQRYLKSGYGNIADTKEQRFVFSLQYKLQKPKPSDGPSIYPRFINSHTLQYMTDTHILQVASWITYLRALFFSVYPCDLFANQSKPYQTDYAGIAKINSDILSKKLNTLTEGSYIKFYTFKKGFFSFDGHSMLIKKINDEQYAFFDPNYGAFNELDFENLTQILNYNACLHEANQMVFVDAGQFVKTYNIQERMEKRAEDSNDLFTPRASFT